jgi:hypothetical protein
MNRHTETAMRNIDAFFDRVRVAYAYHDFEQWKHLNKQEQQMGKAIKLKEANVVAKQYENPWLEAADEAGGGFGKILKFVKGEWEIGEETLPEGKEFIAYIDEVARGYVKFEDKTVKERHIVKVRDGHPPKREDLGDNDPDQWEVGDDGKPRDPYVLQWLLPMSPVDAAGDLTVFCTSSKGGIGAIGLLCKVYGRSERNGLLPIVALKSANYKHPDYGKVFKPDLPIVGWHGSASGTPPDGKPWDDEIPM